MQDYLVQMQLNEHDRFLGCEEQRTLGFGLHGARKERAVDQLLSNCGWYSKPPRWHSSLITVSSPYFRTIQKKKVIILMLLRADVGHISNKSAADRSNKKNRRTLYKTRLQYYQISFEYPICVPHGYRSCRILIKEDVSHFRTNLLNGIRSNKQSLGVKLPGCMQVFKMHVSSLHAWKHNTR